MNTPIWAVWVSSSISVAAFIVSICSLSISRNKLKLDLYSKRFSIYTAIVNYALPFSYKMPDVADFSFNENKEQAMIAFRESKFLFSGDVRIYEKIKGILNLCSFITHYRNDATRRSDVVDKGLTIEPYLVELENFMQPYLGFDSYTDKLFLWVRCIFMRLYGCCWFLLQYIKKRFSI